MDKEEVIWLDKPQVSHKVDVKSQKIFCPQVKDLDHGGPNLIEPLQSPRTSALGLCSSIAEASDWIKWPKNNVGEEQEHYLCHLPR